MRTTPTIVKKMCDTPHTFHYALVHTVFSHFRDDVAARIKNLPPASPPSPNTADPTAFATLKKGVDYAWPRRAS
jgi:hypothetical protein